MKEQALQAGVEIVYADVTGVTLTGETKSVATDKGTYEAKRIILANGGTPRKLGIPGEAELAGIAAWQDGVLLRHEDCILALNRLSSYFYLLQLRAATGDGANRERNERT